MKNVILTVDLGFGDAGKGSIVDFLTRHHKAHTVIRYNGGAQAGHRVVTSGSSPQEHVFSQFGSGTLAGASTHLSRFMLLDPLAMVAEAAHLQTLGIAHPFGITTIDQQALVITPFQRAVNRLKELARGNQRHGSCGMGIGETKYDHLTHGQQVLVAGDLKNRDCLHKKLQFLRQVNLEKLQRFQEALPDGPETAVELSLLTDPDEIDFLMAEFGEFAAKAQIVPGDYLHTILQQQGTVIFEGAQGVLLDEWLGFHPHTTWSTITLENADLLLREADYDGDVSRLGITRAYATRHGAGPFVTEDVNLAKQLLDPRNGFDSWQEGFRVGWLDLLMLRYARDVVGRLDSLAVTCLDRLKQLSELKYCDHYQFETLRVDQIMKTNKPQSLDYQAQITKNLKRCKPILTNVGDIAELPGVIEAKLGVPVEIVSWGETAVDKQFT